MALRKPYDFDTNLETNPYGEKKVSVADPIGSAQGAHTFYLSRRFNFDDGDYTFIVSADDAATVWIGTDQLNARIIAQPVLDTPARADLHIPTGEYRIDVIVTNLPADPSPCYFTMVILRGNSIVYLSDKDGWILDDAAISDDDLPPGEDPRYSLPVWSVLPNWENGVTERLSWMTDVLSSETASEQRRSVRRNARRSFEASFLRQRAQASRMDSFFVGVGADKFLLPIWHEQVKMLDGLDMEAAGVAFPEGDLHFREFRKGDIVFVNNGDPDNYDLLEVGDVEEMRFSWAFPPPRSWPVGTRIFPMREARIVTQDPTMARVTDTVATAQVLFDLVEPYDIAESWGTQQSGDPLFRFKVHRADPIDQSFSRKNYVLDNTSGVLNVTNHGRYTATTVQAKLRLFGKSAAFSMRQFMQAARGRARHFYCPTFTQDIQPLGDIIENTTDLRIMPQGFKRAMLRPQPTRTRLAFQFRDKTETIYRFILDAHEVVEHGVVVAEVLVLNGQLPAIRLADLKRISFLCETRFDQDQFEIHHPTNGQAVIDIALVLRQATNQRDAE